MKNRKAFNFYRSYYEVALELPEKERLEFLMALLTVQFTGEETALAGMAKFAYLSQKHSIDAQIQGFIHKSSAPPKQTPVATPCQVATEGTTVAPSAQEKDKGKEEVKEKEQVKEKVHPQSTFEKFTNELKAHARQTENPTSAGQSNPAQKETKTSTVQTNAIYTAATHRQRLNQTQSQIEILTRAMKAGCGGGTMADLHALIDLADARFNASYPDGAMYSRYLQYVTSCVTNERKLPGKAQNQQQPTLAVAKRLPKRNNEN